jgi:flagellar basal body-associated protein FliL
MAEEQANEAEATGGGGGFLRTLIILVVVVLVAAAAGLATFQFVLRPMLAEAPEEEEPTPRVPETVVTVAFEDAYVNVRQTDPDLPPALLWFKVSVECANPETSALVTQHQARFADMLTDIHSYHEREALEDPLVRESLKKKALQRANEILKVLPVQLVEDIRIISVFYEKFLITEQ